MYDVKAGIIEHLENMHAISGQLVEGLHYGVRTETAAISRYRENWRKQWDSYHDKAASAGISHS
ncbi:hypothetical protein FRC08_007090 [Ceratobasidium sp. 394]|nr:hypothetical protein FRC08_007090 [Ceratobasidium sp. 394]